MKSYGVSIFPMFLIALAFQLLPATAVAQHYGRCGNCGTVVDVDQIYFEEDSTTDGAVVGAIIGGLLGNQVGSGSGRTAATVGGAVAGGFIGKNVDQGKGKGGERGLRIEVRLDKGGYRTVEILGNMRIYRNDRVRVYRDRVELL